MAEQTEVRLLDMVKGRKYEIHHMIKGVQRYPRKSCMTFLGIVSYSLSVPQRGGLEFQFSARPAAGNQSIARDHIVKVLTVHPNTPHYVNARA